MGALSEALKGIELPEETKALVAQADALLDRQYEQASYIEHLQSEIKRLQKEKGISGIRDGLTFNGLKGGIWTDEKGQHYCPKCLDDNKRNPLWEDKYHFRCNVCGNAYSDPDKPLPTIRTGGSWGRGRI
jgi:hypothetical protein